MKVTIRANGTGTYVYEVETDSDELPSLSDFEGLEKLRHDLSQLRAIESGFVPTEQTTDLLLIVEMLALKPTTAFSASDIVNEIRGAIAYMEARHVLLTLYDHGCVKRFGNGGRGGYRYQWAPGYAHGDVEPPPLETNT